MILGTDYAYLSITKYGDGSYLSFSSCINAEKGGTEKTETSVRTDSSLIYLRVNVSTGGKCQFSYSRDGLSFPEIGEIFVAKPGRWTGAKLGIFCSRKGNTNDAGFADLDWFRVEFNRQ